MRIVIDSNIFISAFFYKGNPLKIWMRVIEGLDALYITKDIIEEIEDVIYSEKFKADKNEIERFIKVIKKTSKLITPSTIIDNVCRDKDDNKILSCAISANADFIITGDKDLLVLKEFNNIKILTSKEYLEYMNLNT